MEKTNKKEGKKDTDRGMNVNTFPTEHLRLNYFPCKKLFDQPFPFGCPVSVRFPKHQQQTAGVFL